MYNVMIRSIVLKLHSKKIVVLTLDKHFKDTDPTEKLLQNRLESRSCYDPPCWRRKLRKIAGFCGQRIRRRRVRGKEDGVCSDLREEFFFLKPIFQRRVCSSVRYRHPARDTAYKLPLSCLTGRGRSPLTAVQSYGPMTWQKWLLKIPSKFVWMYASVLYLYCRLVYKFCSTK